MQQKIPALVPGVQPVYLDDGTVAIRSWHRTLQLRGASSDLTLRLLATIDGRKSFHDLAVETGIEISLVEKVLHKLAASRIVVLTGPEAASAQTLSYGFACGEAAEPSPNPDDPVAAPTVVGSGRAALFVTDHLRELVHPDVTLLKSLDDLTDSDIGVGPLVFAEELLTYADALAVDHYAAANGIPWCAGWWEGSRVVISHEMRFGRSACFECLLQRQRANYTRPELDIPLEALLREGSATTAGTTNPETVPSVVSSLLADLLASRAWSMTSPGKRSKRNAQLGEFDLAHWMLNWSTVLRLPSCPHCAPGALWSGEGAA